MRRGGAGARGDWFRLLGLRRHRGRCGGRAIDEVPHHRVDEIVAAHAGEPVRGDAGEPEPDAGEAPGDGGRGVRVPAVADRPLHRPPIVLGLREGLPRRPERVDHVPPARAARPSEQLLVGCLPGVHVAGEPHPVQGAVRPLERGLAGAAQQQVPRDEDVERARDLREEVAVGHRGGAEGAVHEDLVGAVAVHERKGQDAHQRAVAVVPFADAPGLLGRHAAADPRQGGGRRPSDVEAPVAVRRVRAVVGPRNEPGRLVGRVEQLLACRASTQQRVQERQHQRAVVAPGAGRLVVSPLHPEVDTRDRGSVLELVGHAHRIADEVAPYGPREPIG